jgi:hypothetical protein
MVVSLLFKGFLDRIVVTDLKNPNAKYYFPCSQWLAKDEGDGLICRDLMAFGNPFEIRKSKIKLFSYYFLMFV